MIQVTYYLNMPSLAQSCIHITWIAILDCIQIQSGWQSSSPIGPGPKTYIFISLAWEIWGQAVPTLTPSYLDWMSVQYYTSGAVYIGICSECLEIRPNVLYSPWHAFSHLWCMEKVSWSSCSPPYGLLQPVMCSSCRVAASDVLKHWAVATSDVLQLSCSN